MKTTLFFILAALASASSAQAPQQPFRDWLEAQIRTASVYAQITEPSQDGMHFYFLGRRDALLEVQDRLP